MSLHSMSNLFQDYCSDDVSCQIFIEGLGLIKSPGLPEAFRQCNDAIRRVSKEAAKYQAAEQDLAKVLAHLKSSVENIFAHYKAATVERDRFADLLASAEGRLHEVQRVLTRYTIVNDPVVASDGFTYERRIIKQYLDECMRTGASPVSQQTQSELTSTLIPNQSLKKLIDLLKNAKPDEPPKPSVAAPRVSDATPKESEKPQKRLHPCIRVYGYCNYKETCTYALYPYDACLSHLKGKCRFGSQCHELHVDWRGPTPFAKKE